MSARLFCADASDVAGATGVSGAMGIALDIGTTTVSASLVNLETAAVLDTVSELNDQRRFGADVLSRIGMARKGRTEELFTAINRQTQKIINCFKDTWGISKIEKLSVSGNTAMLHFFLNIDPSGMGAAPFTPAFLDEKILPGQELSLSAETVIILPSVSSFIGADIAAGLTALNILARPGPSLLVDIGTNGEMALAHNGTVFCCSAAAGPAFEGAEISCGMGGVAGAINTVTAGAAASVIITTIGNIPPLGVCGSGLIDAVALMIKQGIIDETGSMVGAKKEFCLAPGIVITQKDVRQFQLAKSALYTGIRLLCAKAGLHAADVRNVFIAGSFGSFINKHNAVAAGIFPEELSDVLSVCGNSSLLGATQCLTDINFIKKCKQIIGKCAVLDLAADPLFADEFARNMLF